MLELEVIIFIMWVLPTFWCSIVSLGSLWNYFNFSGKKIDVFTFIYFGVFAIIGWICIFHWVSMYVGVRV